MKKIIGLLFMLFMITSVAFADVVTVFDGHYDLLGQRVSFSAAYLICTILLLIIAIADIIIINKKVKSKKGLFISLIIVLFVLLVLFLPAIMPEPEINHYRIIPDDAIGIAKEASNMMDAKRVEIYNSQFQEYEGTNKKPSEARSIITLVKAHNANSYEVEDFGKIELDKISSTQEVSGEKIYSIKLTGFGDNGAVNKISITEEQ